MTRLKPFLTAGVFIVLLVASNQTVKGQVRFYLQYETIPFLEGGSSDFNALVGLKLDPNKELTMGLGLSGKLDFENLSGNLRFEKSSITMGFNYYQTRRLYYNINFNLNVLTKIIETSINEPEELINKVFLDYQINITYILLRRLHFSLASSITHLSNLVVDTSSEFIDRGTLPSIALSMKLYVFQIKL